MPEVRPFVPTQDRTVLRDVPAGQGAQEVGAGTRNTEASSGESEGEVSGEYGRMFEGVITAICVVSGIIGWLVISGIIWIVKTVMHHIQWVNQ